MRRSQIKLAAFFAATMAGGAISTAAQSGLRLDGGFIQYQAWMMKLTPDDWRAELEAMRRAKMQTVIIQWLELNETRFIPSEPGRVDPTQVILDAADGCGMEVFIGLAMDEAWWGKRSSPGYLTSLADRNIRAAEEAWKRYGKHRSLKGWYIPLETWDDFPDDLISDLRTCFRRISDRCKSLSGNLPVAMAPFFTGGGKPETIEKAYAQLLTGSGIDILMLQDGVGSRGWDRDLETRVVPYFRAMREACLESGVELWSDLESFRLVAKPETAPAQTPPRFVAADADRIARQLAAEAPFVQRLVTFDFFHYMSPHRGGAQKRLYDDYRQRCVDRPFIPSFGRSVEVDPAAFAYYRDRSPRSIASEIRASGYSVVLYVVTTDSDISRPLIEALHAEGVGVWYCTFGNGVYSRKDLPPGWESWRMVCRSDLEGKPLIDGYTRLCLNNPAYRRWRKARIAGVLRKFPFEGVQIMEPHWPEYPGIESPAYGCFCPACQETFRTMFPGGNTLPDILHADSPRSPSKNPALWHRWLEFRRRTLTAFLDDLVNGAGGIRKTSPRALVCTWTLALTQPDGLQRVLEDSGEDAGEVARVVRPDLHCLQTHWPDWIRADLRSDYVRAYRPFIDNIRSASPSTPIMIQADTGSQLQNRRSWKWIEDFENACWSVGATGTTLYEYCLGKYIYADPPRVACVRGRAGRVELHFTKRLDPGIAARLDHYQLKPGRISSVQVDGSIVTLSVQGIHPGEHCELTLHGLSDDPSRRLLDDRRPAVLQSQTVRWTH